MVVRSTDFSGLYVLEPKVIGDARGYFMEAYSYKVLASSGISTVFVQDNHSRSTKGVLRGLHYQNAPHAQAKLIRVISGSILDVVVDLRKEEPSFGAHFSAELSAENKKQLFVPKGFAHGFVVLSDQVEVLYKCDEYYYPGSEGGIAYNDPNLKIDWRLSPDEFILSDRDKVHPTMENAVFRF